MIGRALVVWLLMMATETIHGVLRNRFLVPVIGDVGSRQIGVLIGSALILGLAILTIGWIHPTSERSLLAIGAMWLTLTLAFEFGLGRALGRPWAAMLADYDLSRGGLLSIGMVVVALSPGSPRAAVTLRRSYSDDQLRRLAPRVVCREAHKRCGNPATGIATTRICSLGAACRTGADRRLCQCAGPYSREFPVG
jgi:hypothetical protein